MEANLLEDRNSMEEKFHILDNRSMAYGIRMDAWLVQRKVLVTRYKSLGNQVDPHSNILTEIVDQFNMQAGNTLGFERDEELAGVLEDKILSIVNNVESEGANSSSNQLINTQGLSEMVPGLSFEELFTQYISLMVRREEFIGQLEKSHARIEYLLDSLEKSQASEIELPLQKAAAFDYFHLNMRENPWEGKINTVEQFKNLNNRTVSLQKRMDVLYHDRTDLLLRINSIKSLDIRFRKQYNEILHLKNRNRGKELEFLDDKSFDLSKVKLLETVTKTLESWSANEDTYQLTSDQELEDAELYGKIEFLMLNQANVLTLRDEFFAQEETANARIKKLLNHIRK